MDIKYLKSVKKDLQNIDKHHHTYIQQAIHNKLLVHPETYSIPLKGTLKPIRKFRIGQYRVIHYISNNTIEVQRIVHRSEAYRN